MSELGTEAQDLLRRAREEAAATPEEKARARARVIAAASAVAAGGSLGASSAAALSTKAALITAGVLAAAGLTLAVAWSALAPEASEPAPLQEQVVEPAPRASELEQREAEPEPVADVIEQPVALDEPHPVADVIEQPVALGDPEPPPRAERRARSTVRAADEAVAATPEPPIDPIAAELEILRPAFRALARHDLDRALERIEEHARRFPEGQLAHERERARERWRALRDADDR